MAKSIRTALRWLLRGLGIIIAAALLIFFGSVLLTRMPGEGLTAGGVRQDRALYVPMRDGVKLALDVWLPQSYRPGERVPTIIRWTRYWRLPKYSWVARGLYGLGLFPTDPVPFDARASIKAGYAVVLVDSRGTGASEGRSRILFDPEEVKDIGDVADWIVAQPWSNGKIGATGISYNGHMAEFVASVGHPAIKAVAPLYDFFDLDAMGVLPGGIRAQQFVDFWSDLTVRLDADDFCRGQPISCRLTAGLLMGGVKPVDADAGGRRLAAIVAARHNVAPADGMKNLQFRDDLYDHTPFNLGQRSPYSQKAAVEAGGAALFIWNGWLDSGNADGALSRYRGFSNPQWVTIGKLSHGGLHDTDPFAPADRSPDPSSDEQMAQIVGFFDHYLKDGPPRPITPRIRYATLGASGYRETAQWPPSGFTSSTLYLAAGGALAPAPAPVRSEARYQVDFSTTMGEHNRWRTTMGGGDVIYPDRRDADRKLLVFNSSPFAADTEITGAPVVTLYGASTRQDGALFVYLEDVAPGGRVTYITEGELRVIDRKEGAPGTAPYVPMGPWHSLLRRDAQPLQPGVETEFRIGLFTTSVVIRRGHRLRVAVAGADTSEFVRIPASGPAPVWTFSQGGPTASRIDFPQKAWTGR